MIGYARTARILRSAVFELMLPIAVAFALVSVLTDPAHIVVTELSANSLMMNARPMFRVIAPGDELRVALGSSALLLVTAMSGAVVLGVPAAMAYAWSRRRATKALVWSVATVTASLPAFFWAVSLELVMIFVWLRFGVRLLPTAGFGIDEHLVLPALALAIRPAAYIFRLTALAIEGARHADYVRTGVAKGLDDRVLLTRHILPNAAPQIIAAVVLGARGALSSLVIVEFVYVWGGAGLMFVQAVGDRKLVLAGELALSFAIGSALLALAADVARARVRVRA